jgi:hypothetical protein
MTTDTSPIDPVPVNKTRRRHPAAGARIITAGLSSTAVFTIIAALGAASSSAGSSEAVLVKDSQPLEPDVGASAMDSISNQVTVIATTQAPDGGVVALAPEAASAVPPSTEATSLQVLVPVPERRTVVVTAAAPSSGGSVGGNGSRANGNGGGAAPAANRPATAPPAAPAAAAAPQPAAPPAAAPAPVAPAPAPAPAPVATSGGSK